MFFQLLAIGGSTGVNEISLRGLGSTILNDSNRLSPQEDVRYLRAFVGVGLHMIDSNRMLFAVTAASIDRVLKRLMNIAIDQGDFQHADEIMDIQRHVWNVQRKVIDAYHEIEIGEDPAHNDRDATKIMAANRKAMTVPTIQFATTAEPAIDCGRRGSCE